MKPVRAAIFDLEGVMVRWEGEHPHVGIARELGVDYTALRASLDKFLPPLDVGEITVDEMYAATLADLGLPPERIIAFQDAYLPNITVDHDMEDFARTLRPRLRTALLSNYSLRLRGLLETRWKIADAFDEIIISAEVKMMKPQPEIYLLTLEKLGCAAEEAVFVDDRLENVRAAEALGIRSVLFTETASVIRALRALIGQA